MTLVQRQSFFLKKNVESVFCQPQSILVLSLQCQTSFVSRSSLPIPATGRQKIDQIIIWPNSHLA